MSMKAITEPRRIYRRRGIVHVCFDGTTWCPNASGTKFNFDREVKVETADVLNGRKRVRVTQRLGAKRTLVSEIWHETRALLSNA